MKYGQFSENGKEYIITRPDTPTPWINYLSNSNYCAMVSNTGGGYSFHIDPRDRRILRYRYNNLPMDRPGRYIYIQNSENFEYWSPTWQPVQNKLDFYECRHGLGYTKIKSSYKDIRAEILYFVPMKDDLEIWMITIQNKSGSKKKLNIYSYAEFCLWSALKDQNDLQYIQNVALARFDKDVIYYHLYDHSSDIIFFTSNAKIIGYDCDREIFIGPYRSEANPLSIEQGKCFNSEALGGNPVAVTCNELELKSGETKTIIFILGIIEKKSVAKKLIEKYKYKKEVEIEFKNLCESWDNYLSAMIVDTPDKNFNTIVNIWNPYQCRTTFQWSRYVSYYETGIGRGMGFRDVNQDSLGICYIFPDRVRKRLLEVTATQFEAGYVYHNYFPLTGEGAFPDYTNPLQPFFGDDHLWLVISVCNYIKETGDFTILNEEIPFVEKSKASMYNHLQRALDFTSNNMGPHDFPLIGTADWNDTLQLHGPNKAGESIWIAMLFHKVLVEISDIAKAYNRKEDCSRFLKRADQIKRHLNKASWDGRWYIRGYTDSGRVIGSKKNKSGKIFLNSQTWAVFSGIAPQDRAKLCMDSVSKYLETEYGIKLLYPPFTKYDPELGGISSYQPGLKENAAIFCHTNPWAVIAECILGRGDQAYSYFKKIAPFSKNDIADIHRTEPYIYSQMITGNDHPGFGAAKNSWLTGTASWTLKACTDWILGIRPQINGLLVDPCIPKEWDQFKVMRHFRNQTYEIKVNNPDHVSKGVKQVKIDNKSVSSNLLPIFKDGKIHKIDITMGKV